ncbi:MAG TPA: DUF4142 domain-containing protein [Flavisolibacter sp.]|nr:DUF4142 domain-containing protein [Flavisolibacter sp.]
MKRSFLIPFFAIVIIVYSCNNNNTDGQGTTANDPTPTTTIRPEGTSAAPLNSADSIFVLEQAMGGMMEVEAGNLAQQNAQHQRVKAFGEMMVRDHSQANNELASLAAGRGIRVPDSVSGEHRKHVESLRKMTGKNFDSHYISMMVQDHKKMMEKLENAATTVKDADLQNWITKTLPVVRAHFDSAQAISKTKM